MQSLIICVCLWTFHTIVSAKRENHIHIWISFDRLLDLKLLCAHRRNCKRKTIEIPIILRKQFMHIKRRTNALNCIAYEKTERRRLVLCILVLTDNVAILNVVRATIHGSMRELIFMYHDLFVVCVPNHCHLMHDRKRSQVHSDGQRSTRNYFSTSNLTFERDALVACALLTKYDTQYVWHACSAARLIEPSWRMTDRREMIRHFFSFELIVFSISHRRKLRTCHRCRIYMRNKYQNIIEIWSNEVNSKTQI